MPRKCVTLLRHAEVRTVPPEWSAAEVRIAAEARHLDQLLASSDPPAIYGVNTLVGHLDDASLEPAQLEAFQTELLRNHALGGPPYYDQRETVCIGYARAHFFSLGGSAISLDLYRHLYRAVADRALRPNVPRGCSYSCGDVIPGAHWALALVDFLQTTAGYVLRRKEGLALLNGSFVHVGFALSQLPLLRGAWRAFLAASRLNARLCQAHRSNYTTALADDPADPIRRVSDLIHEAAPAQSLRDATPQDPISIRAFPQVAGAVAQALSAYMDALDQALARRSDNPLIVTDSNTPLSQGSFLAPMLTLAVGQLIEAVLLAMWMQERRTHHLLSGRVAGIPATASRSATDLGLIQVPKLMTAVLEEARLLAGRRSFAAGSSTSYGVEDLWSYGVNTSEILALVVQRWRRLLAMELTIAAECFAAFVPAEDFSPDVLTLLPAQGLLAERFDVVSRLIAEEKLPGEDVFPFEE